MHLGTNKIKGTNELPQIAGEKDVDLDQDKNHDRFWSPNNSFDEYINKKIFILDN